MVLNSISYLSENNLGNKITNARLAMGGVAHKPWRLTELENYLKGKEASENNFQQAAAIASGRRPGPRAHSS